MAKKYLKMVLYAEPGVGKSTFASKAPNPFFICTDGNFGWLDLPDEQHVQISNGPQFEKIIDLISEPRFDWCDTVVVDLLEEAYLMHEASFCKKKKIESIGDLDFGKGYDLTRKSFLVLISKLISLPKHVLFLMHGEDDISTKDVRGNVITKHVPSSKLPKKLLSSIEGKVQYFLRAYIKAEPSTDPNSTKVYKKRYLSLIPKANDYGISRGADENNFPEDIELDWDVFAEVIGLNEENTRGNSVNDLQNLLDEISDAPVKPVIRGTVAPTITKPVVPAKPTTVAKPTTTVKSVAKPVEEAKVEEETEEEVEELTLNKATTEEVKTEVAEAPKASKADLLAKLKKKENIQKPTQEVSSKEEPESEETTVETEKETVSKVSVQTEAPKTVNQQSISDKLAALKAAKLKK